MSIVAITLLLLQIEEGMLNLEFWGENEGMLE